MTRPALFDTGPTAARWRGTTALVPTPPRCPRPTCRQPLVRLPGATQPALFIHGGYGAAQQHHRDLCTACGHVRHAATRTLNPRHLTTADTTEAR